MKRASLLCVLLSLAISASAEPFGLPFPVTNTRYSTALGAPRLITNDRDFFLFWGADQSIRVARVDDGEARVSHAALDTNRDYDVAWTGEHFLIVGTRPSNITSQSRIVGRILDAEARPIGAELPIVSGSGFDSRIAAGSHSIAVVYRTNSDIRLVILSKNGRIVSPSRVIGSYSGTHAVTRSGDGFLVIYTPHAEVRALRIDADGQTIAETSFNVPATHHEVALAGDGTKALAILAAQDEVRAVPLDDNANFGAPLGLGEQPGRFMTPTVVWNGAGWTVSYAHQANDSKAVIEQIHWRGQMVLGREEIPIAFHPTVAALDGQMIAAWRKSGGVPVVQGLPLAEHQPREAPYAPLPQTLLASASSSEGTLTVWSEKIHDGLSIHAGFRNLQGQWSERQLKTLPANQPLRRALAASDGNGFAVVLVGLSSTLIRLDSAGRPSGTPIGLPGYPMRAIAWNGTNYGVIDETGHGVLVSPSGTVSNLVDTLTEFEIAALASDGNGFFLAGNMLDCPFLLCSSVQIRGTRLGPDLKRLEEDDYVIDTGSLISVVGAAWDGSKYFLVANDDERGTRIADIPLSPRAAIDTKVIEEIHNPKAMSLLQDGTVAIAGASRVAIVSRAGAVLHTTEIYGSPTTAPRLEAFANGGVAFLVSSVQDAAPHDGTSRVVTAIARSANVAPPSAPYVGVRVQNGFIHVDWSAPSGTVNGYRLEYRIDDDTWVELEQWFPPGSQRKSIRVPSFGTQFAFRVRAFNDGGAGEYSRTAFTKPSRRRAVR